MRHANVMQSYRYGKRFHLRVFFISARSKFRSRANVPSNGIIGHALCAAEISNIISSLYRSNRRI